MTGSYNPQSAGVVHLQGNCNDFSLLEFLFVYFLFRRKGFTDGQFIRYPVVSERREITEFM